MKILTGNAELMPSNNTWDWLGNGVYFWEQNPARALEYAIENARGIQFNKIKIRMPFVLGANIELGNCLNLIDMNSLQIVRQAYLLLLEIFTRPALNIPINKGNNRALDCAVFKHLHRSNEETGRPPYDTIRCPFREGKEIYPGAAFTDRMHIQISVLNMEKITGYFLPKPIKKFNPYLHQPFTP